MQHRTGMLAAGDGQELFVQCWLPDAGEPKAVLFLIHGLAEHSGRYEHVGRFMADRGYGVYAMDLRGHGRSPGLRGYIDHYETYLADLDRRFQQVLAENPGRKMFVIGHSMGGALALAFTARHQADQAGVITSGALIVSAVPVPPAAIAVNSILARVLPKLPLMALDGTAVSRNPAVREAYDSDPLNYRGKIRARLGQQLFALADDARRGLPTITIPILAMHGTADRLTSPAGLDIIEREIASADKTCRRYEGLYHEIFNEPEQVQVLGDVAGWLDRHL